MEKINSNLMYIFPGQGAQYVGMGADLYHEFASARAVYDKASETVGFDVAALSFQGPKEQLDATEYCQVALLTHSIACLEAFKEITGNKWAPKIVAGHSLGEYSALVASGALAFSDAIELVRQRGRLMADYGRGSMVAFPLDLESIKPFADAHYCGIGGCNLPEQTVVCGLQSDLEMLVDAVVDKFGRAKAGRFLNTAGAFHTYMMIGAAEQFRPHLEAISLRDTNVKILSNYTGDYHSTDPAVVKAALFFQISNPVKWMHGLERAIADGINTIIEFGGGVGKDGAASANIRRPNLEGITRKTLRGCGVEGIYLPAINSVTVRQAERKLSHYLALKNPEISAGNDESANNVWIHDKSWRLFIPVRHNTPSSQAIDLAAMVDDMSLATIVPIFVENHEDNLQFLQRCVDSTAMDEEPYLEVLVGGCSASVLHYRRDDIRRELAELSSQMQIRQMTAVSEM